MTNTDPATAVREALAAEVERVARAMLAAELKVGGDRRDFEAVWAEEGPVWLANAETAMRETRLIDAEALREGLYGLNEEDAAEVADWLEGRADAE